MEENVMKVFNKIFILWLVGLTNYLFSEEANINPIDPAIFVNPEQSLKASGDDIKYDIGRNLVNGHANSRNDVVTSRNSSKQIVFSKKTKGSKEKIIPYNYNYEKALLLLRGWDSANVPPKTTQLTIIDQKDIDSYNNLSIKENSIDKEKLNKLLAQKNTFDAICYIPYTLKFSFVPRNIKMHCKRTDNFSNVKINVTFTPKNESFILLGTPYAYEIESSLYQANTEISEVTNSLNSDFNVATSVNTQAIQTAIDAATEAIGNSIGRNTNRYVTQLEASQQRQEIYRSDNYHSNNSTLAPIIIKSTNTDKPDWKEYAISSAIGGLGDAISNIASQLKTKYPYLYEIEKGTTLYVKVVPKY